MGSRKTLHFKFRPTSGAGERDVLLRALREQGAADVERLFPDGAGTDLALLYSVHYNDDPTGAKLRKLMDDSSSVEFAEEGVVRTVASREPKPKPEHRATGGRGPG